MLGDTVCALLSTGNSADCLPTEPVLPVCHQGSTAVCSTAHGLGKTLHANQCQQITKESVVSLQHAEPFPESTVNPGLLSLSLEKPHIHAKTASEEATSLDTA